VGDYVKNYESEAKFSDLKGQTIIELDGLQKDSDYVSVKTKEGKEYQWCYHDDCCAKCSIEDITGDVEDVIGSEILLAEEVSQKELKESDEGSFTWTFYKLSTIKGSITVRWYGSSNGYYSESVSFEDMPIIEE
jgi:hypothetical protein